MTATDARDGCPCPLPEFFPEPARTGFHVTDFTHDPADLVKRLNAENGFGSYAVAVEKKFTWGRALHEYFDGVIFPGGKSRAWDGKTWKSGKKAPLAVDDFFGFPTTLYGELDLYGYDAGGVCAADVKSVKSHYELYSPLVDKDVPAAWAFQFATYMYAFEAASGRKVDRFVVAVGFYVPDPKPTARETKLSSVDPKTAPDMWAYHDDAGKKVWYVYEIFPSTRYAELPGRDEVARVVGLYGKIASDYVEGKEITGALPRHRFLYDSHNKSKDYVSPGALSEWAPVGETGFGFGPD